MNIDLKQKNLFSKYYTVRITPEIYINTVIQNVIGRFPLPFLSLLKKSKNRRY